ncbi:B-cell linker protein isoform X1 [Salvelinus sp. IW2-2015]|uniref:B-cell linker protein isoform X1 n=1 Tax=Salvelinus sp. IW2-2015 TaxID=2691554 RepID=UPI000CDF9EC8|nr:B-cell linker protein isoform X1 [Salvelinus alpinus]
MNLPSREQCEDWSSAQVANLLRQNQMQECAATVERMRISGQRFMNLSDSDLSRFSLIHQPQLQKMVQDIKKNDGSILNRLRRFKNKSAPKVPVRDYQGDDLDVEQWSENEFDSDTYEEPQGEQDDSYEPPPSQSVFTPTSSACFSRGEYVDSCRDRPNHPPRKPICLPKPTRASPSLPPKPNQQDDNEEDYVIPKSDDEDNYVDPTEESPANRPMHGRGKPVKSSPSMSKTVPERSNSPDVYEVPDIEENSPPPVSRPSTLKVPAQGFPPRASPRMHLKTCPPIPVQESIDDEYEVCDPDQSGSTKSAEMALPVHPKPLPREMKPLKPPLMPRQDIASRENEGPALAMRHSTQKPTTTPQPSEYKRTKTPLPQMFTSQKPDRGTVPTAENKLTDAEERADVLKKPWYASTCDRKTAEDTLVRLNKDGAFLIRKSSGQDRHQPYTLVVYYNSRVYNIPVRYIQASQQYTLGREKKGEERFTSVSHIIENHQRNPLVLIDSQRNTKDFTKLCYAVKP